MHQLEYIATYIHRGPSVLDLVVVAALVIGLMVIVIREIIHDRRDGQDRG